MRQRYLRDLYNAIITKDIITRYNIRDSKTLKDLAAYLTSNYSCKISYNKLKNIFNAKSVHTIENYVSYIEEAYLVFQVFPFSYKTKLQLMSPKKIYAIDTGLIDALTAKHFDNTCWLLENIVALELFRKRTQNQYEIYSYKSKQQQEVDFVILKANNTGTNFNKTTPCFDVCGKAIDSKTQGFDYIKKGLNIVQLIQVCYSLEDEKTKKRELSALLKAGKDLKCKNLLIITWDYAGEEEINTNRIIYIPLWKWLMEKHPKFL